METKRLNIQIDLHLAARWTALRTRFNYNTNIKLMEDLIYFFETNPVTPKQQFGGLLKDIEKKIDEFHNDNNRVIAVVRNMEKHKIDALYRILSGSVTDDLSTIISHLSTHKFKLPNSNIDTAIIKNDTLIDNNIANSDNTQIEKLKESYDNKLKNANEKYAFLQKEYGLITLEHGKYFSILKKLETTYLVEKSTFTKNKIYFEMTEDEFKTLIKR